MGIYSRPSWMHQDSEKLDHYFVDKDLCMNMELFLYNYDDIGTISNNFSWKPTAIQWWVCGFNPSYAGNVVLRDLVAVSKIDMSDKGELFDCFYKEYDENFKNNVKYNQFLEVDPDTKMLWIMWGKK